MNRSMRVVGLMLGVVVAALGAGCDGTDCGEGTRKVDGACIPTSDLCGPNTSYDPDTGQCTATSSCASGTTEQDGECVPDGSVVCETGTTFDPETGTCVADITGCAAGTVLIAGECVPEEDARSASIEEGAEPNDTSAEGGSIPVPAEGNDITVHGCITPYVDADENGELDADLDAFTLEVSGPTLLDVTVDGVGGLAGAFLLTSEVEAVAADGWTRFGINLVGDVSQRQVFLPAAGRYVLQFADGRSLFLGAPAGSDDTCYYATIQTLTIPAASPITTDASGDFEEVRFFRYDPTSDGEILASLLFEDSSSATGGLVQLVGNEYRLSGGSDVTTEIFGGGLRDDDDVLIVVDATYDFALEPVDFELLLEPYAATPLENGDPTTVLHDADGGNLVWFDATAGEVVSFDLVASDPLAFAFYGPNLEPLGTLCSEGDPCTSDSGVLQILDSGIHYAHVINTDAVADGQSYDLVASWTGETPTPLAIDMPLTAVPLSEDGADWYELTIVDMAWLVFSGTPVNFSPLLLDAYDRSMAGLLDEAVPSASTLAFDGTEFGHVFDLPEGVAEVTYLVRLADPSFDGTADDESYDFAVLERPHTTIDLVAADTHTEMDTALDADGVNHYLVLAPSERLRIDVSEVAGSDVVLEVLDDDENVVVTVDDAGAAMAEGLALFNAPAGWRALAVSDQAGVAGDYDLTASIVLPDYAETTAVGEQLPGDGSALEATVSVAGTCTIDAAAIYISSTSERWDVDFSVTSPLGTPVALTASDVDGTVIDGTFPTDIEPTESLEVLAGEDGIGDWTFTLSHTFAWAIPGFVDSVGVDLYCQ